MSKLLRPELKFKTIILNKLISCNVNHTLNRIISEEGIFIGRIEDRGEERPKIIPIFQFTGRKDKHGEEIYLGHKIELRVESCNGKFDISLYYVCWDGYSFYLDKTLNNDIVTFKKNQIFISNRLIELLSECK